MSIKSLEYDDFGSFEEIKFFLTLLSDGEPRDLGNIRSYCISNSFILSYPFDGIVGLLEFISMIEIQTGRVKITISDSDVKKIASNKFELSNAIVPLLLNKLADENLLNNFLDYKKIQYDVKFSSVVIKNNSIPLKFSALKNLLLNLSFFEIHNESPIDL